MDEMADIFNNSATTRIELAESLIDLATPKPTELYLSDIHGEYESFSYMLRSGCGSVRSAAEEALPKASEGAISELVLLICYPDRALERRPGGDGDAAWLTERIVELGKVMGCFARKTSRFFFEQAIEGDYATLIENLALSNALREQVASAAIEAKCAEPLIVALCEAIRRIAVGRVHIVGDIYDRGPAPEAIMEELIEHPSLDVQWGNHDIVWMGAACGQRGCIAHVVRNCARYGNLNILTDAYGMDLSGLIDFANDAYKDDPCVAFGLKTVPEGMPQEEVDLNVRIQKAMAILQFKVEAQLIDDNPSFGLEDRKLLHLIDRETNTVVVDGVEYPITDTVFTTVDFADPYKLTDAEEAVMQSLEAAFTECDLLQRHMAFLLEAGSLYTIANDHLLYHACVPLNDDGTLKTVELFGKEYAGRALFDAVDEYVRAAFHETDPARRKQGLDLIWYLWLGQGSPLFAKSKMATFEIYMIADKAARKEVKNAYYALLEDADVLNAILEDFGVDTKRGRIVCGHVPVKVKDGEDPVKCGGKAIIIDGGMSRAYQKTTGIAGMTLVNDATGVYLYTHEPFCGIEAALDTNTGITSSKRTIELYDTPRTLADTDEGAMMADVASELEQLAEALESNGK